MSAFSWGKLCAKARQLTNTLGYRAAAGYLRNREVPFEVAYQVIFNRMPTR